MSLFDILIHVLGVPGILAAWGLIIKGHKITFRPDLRAGWRTTKLYQGGRIWLHGGDIKNKVIELGEDGQLISIAITRSRWLSLTHPKWYLCWLPRWVHSSEIRIISYPSDDIFELFMQIRECRIVLATERPLALMGMIAIKANGRWGDFGGLEVFMIDLMSNGPISEYPLLPGQKIERGSIDELKLVYELEQRSKGRHDPTEGGQHEDN